jgi:hypothetical protein
MTTFAIIYRPIFLENIERRTIRSDFNGNT